MLLICDYVIDLAAIVVGCCRTVETTVEGGWHMREARLEVSKAGGPRVGSRPKEQTTKDQGS